MRLSAEQLAAIETRIRTSAQQLLGGEIPAGGRCDITTLAQMSGVSRAALYRTHRALKDEFDRAVGQQQDAGEIPDPREARIAKLKQAVDALNTRLRERDSTIEALRERQRRLCSQLLAQHEEITMLRTAVQRARPSPARLPTDRHHEQERD